MAKKKDDFSFGFSNKKIEPKKASKPAEPAADAPVDPFATPDAAAADPFATPADPFASPAPDAAADPFATPDAATADPFAAPADPFATPDAAAADPFATPDAAAADPFAAPAESPAEAAPSEAAAPEEPEEEKSSEPQVKQHKQFRILVLADFSGRTNRSVSEVATIPTRKVRVVDADNLDKTIAATKPQIQLPVDDKTMIPLSFAAIEDFRPDALLQKIDAFQKMLTLRAQLKDAKKFKEAAAAVKKLTGGGAKPAKKAAPAAKATAGESDFEQLLNRSTTTAPKNAAQATAEDLIANLVAGYAVPDADPEQAKMVQLVEDAVSAGLRAVLRHPAFQALDGAWRGVEFLVNHLSTDEDLKICVLDISKEELYADLAGPPTIDKTGMYQLLVEQTRAAGAVPYSLVIGDYEFDQTPQNIALLAKIATLMHEAQIPFIAGATAKIIGTPSFEQFAAGSGGGKWQPPTDNALWEKIRGHKLAPHIGLAAPRFMVRLPYGPKTDAIDAYPFDEMPGTPVSAGYLWIDGAYAAAMLIGQAFLDGGWDRIEPGNDVSDLPCHMAVVDGDKEMTPCAQAWLTDRLGDILHQQGIIPLISVRNAAAVKVAGLHSIAKGGKALAASWATA